MTILYPSSVPTFAIGEGINYFVKILNSYGNYRWWIGTFFGKNEGISLGCIVSTVRHNGLMRRCLGNSGGT